MSAQHFPWEVLKAECLRAICSQLVQSTGAHYSETRRREEMISFLTQVETNGLEKASKSLLDHLKDVGKTQRQSSPAKRKGSPSDEQPSEPRDTMDVEENADGYNTRYKGVKRVKVRAATPERTSRTPRKKQNAGAASGAETGAEAVSAGPSAKRGRGRPRKSVTDTAKTGGSASDVEGDEKPQAQRPRGSGRPRKSVPESTSADIGKRPRGRPRNNPLPATSDAPVSKGKEVFDGVVMEKRIVTAKADEPDTAPNPAVPEEEEVGDEDGEGEYEIDPVLLFGHQDDGTSSLGGSNKENEPMAENYTPERDNEDADAHGEPDFSAEVITSTAQEIATGTAQSTVILPTIPMALAASRSSAAPAQFVQQAPPASSTSQDRPALNPL